MLPSPRVTLESYEASWQRYDERIHSQTHKSNPNKLLMFSLEPTALAPRGRGTPKASDPQRAKAQNPSSSMFFQDFVSLGLSVNATRALPTNPAFEAGPSGNQLQPLSVILKGFQGGCRALVQSCLYSALRYDSSIFKPLCYGSGLKVRVWGLGFRAIRSR